MSTPLDFLNLILPSAGLRAAFVIDGEKHWNKFFATNDLLAEYISQQDNLGRTVYHGCSTFDGAGKRSARHAAAVRSFWLDVDAGPNKPYATQVFAAHAVLSFCRTVALPQPLFVGSGAGLHCYWPLDADLPPDLWRRYAEGLKALCAEHDFHPGPERTADLASILRTPGTHHRKGTAKLVECGELVPSYPLARFDVFLSAAPASVAPLSPPAPRKLDPLTAALANSYDPVFADTVADGCAQVSMMRERQGQVPEPHWYAVLGVLAYCIDGEAKAHEWSSGYEGYTFAETQKKLEQTKKLTGATTCEHFSKTVGRGLCAACPLSGTIKSPISAQPVSAATTAVSPSSIPTTTPASSTATASNLFAAPTPGSTSSSAPPTGSTDSLPTLLAPFVWTKRGQLAVQTENRKGEPVTQVVAEYPIYLDSTQIGEIDATKFSYLFKTFLPQEGWKDIHIPAKTLFGPQATAELAERGAVISDREAFRNFAIVSINEYNRTNRLKMRFDQFGWKNDNRHFLYGRSLYGPEGPTPVVVSDELAIRSRSLAPAVGGSLARWKAAADMLFAPGCEAQSFALLCGFAAPLMRFLDTSEGGALVSLVSQESSTGKTTGLLGAASVWGRKDGMDMSNRDTRVSKGLTLAAMGNLLVVYDEMGFRDPVIVRDFVIDFTNGRDRMRGQSDGTIKHTPASWQTIMVVTSNMSIVDMVEAAGGTDAPGFRVLEFPGALPANVQHAQGDRIKRDLEANSGHAGDAYLRYLVQPNVLAYVKTALAEWNDRFYDGTGLRREHRFWVRTLSAVAVAAEIVRKLDLVDFSPERIVKWALEKMVMAKDNASITSSAGSIYANALGQFLNEHIGETIVVRKAWSKGQPEVEPVFKPHHRVVARYELDSGTLLIEQKALRRWMVEHEVNYRQLTGELQAKGVMQGAMHMRTLTAGTGMALGQVPCALVNGRHPMISGVLASIDEFVPPAEPARFKGSWSR